MFDGIFRKRVYNPHGGGGGGGGSALASVYLYDDKQIENIYINTTFLVKKLLFLTVH